MIAEALRWLCTPCGRDARRYGYLYEAIALQARSRRCAAAWAPHLTASRSFLLAAARGRSGRAVILGSGLLLDVPLAELCAIFDEVILVDLVHLWPVRRLARRFPQVHLLTADVSGALAALAERRLGGTPQLPLAASVDWVASVNLYSQLPLLPRRVALQQGHPAPAVDAWSTQLQAHHLTWLRQLAPHGVLLADLRQETRAGTGIVLTAWDSAPLLGDFGTPAKNWSWQLAPAGELADGEIFEHHVGAWNW
jgi:hypothetical protein